MVVRSAAVLAALALSAWVRPALGDDAGPRPATYFAVGTGGYLALTGVGELGPSTEIELYPASWGRFGVRAAYYGFDYDFEGALLTAGVTYTAGSSRPKLHIAVHAELAGTVDDPGGNKLGAGGGVQTQLWVRGPLALGLDTTAHLLFDHDDIVLNLASATTLRLSF